MFYYLLSHAEAADGPAFSSGGTSLELKYIHPEINPFVSWTHYSIPRDDVEGADLTDGASATFVVQFDPLSTFFYQTFISAGGSINNFTGDVAHGSLSARISTRLAYVNAVDENGVVLGTAIFDEHGEGLITAQSVLATPEPPSMVLFAMGLIGITGAVRLRKMS